MQAPEPIDNSSKSKGNSSANAQPPELPELPLPRRFERYTLLKRIARGGMGEVYLAAAGGIEGAERPCVVKTIRREHEGDRSFLARFLDEARIQAQLQHPGVAQILEATNDAEGKPYVVVEYIEGRNLSDVRSRAAQLNVRISWPEALAMGIAMGEALAHVHERTDANGKPLEIVHRDLSPQNVMIGYGGELKLIDFGTARGQNRRCHTVAGIVFAKPGYVAPEVANNTPGAVPADLYAYGVMLWELIAGRRFLVGEASVHMALVAAGKRQPTPLAQLIGAPPEIDQVIFQLTAPKIEDRYASARQAVSDLVKLLQRAPSMANGDRSVRGRIAQLMARLYPAQPARSRAEFARMVAEARAAEPPKTATAVPASPAPAPAVEVDPSILPGTRYRIMREIGRGAMGVVYEAYHVDLVRFVALKVLDKDAVSEAACSRLRAEARAIAQLSHENLVQLYDFGIAADGRPFYAMELLAGESLEKRLERDGAMRPREAVEVVAQACRALEAAHAAGVVHRDIKPGNLMLSSDGTLKLCDFGVAKAESEVEPASDGNGAFTLVGTPEYMAPEQARGQASAQSDVYALAVVLYELIAGRRPHEADTVLALLEQKRNAEVISLCDRAVGVPRELDRVVLAALDPDPNRRPKSAAEFRAALEAALSAPRRSRALRRGLAYAAASVIAATALGIGGMAAARAGLPAQARAALSPVVERIKSVARGPVAPQTPAVVKAAPSMPVIAPVAIDVDEEEQSDELTAEPAGEVSAESAALEAEAAPEQPAASEIASADDSGVLAEVERLKAAGSKLKALELLRRAAAKDPKNAAVLEQLCLTQEELKAWGEAARVARRWAKVDPRIETQLKLARLERATGHRDRAVSIARKVLKEAPESKEALALLAELGAPQRVALR